MSKYEHMPIWSPVINIFEWNQRHLQCTIVESIIICRASHVTKNSKRPSAKFIKDRILKYSELCSHKSTQHIRRVLNWYLFLFSQSGNFEFLITWLARHIINDSTVINYTLSAGTRRIAEMWTRKIFWQKILQLYII